MSRPETCFVALKEWHVVCRAIESGRQCILLRKGGIYESAGEFRVEHERFLLFPTYLHQDWKMLKPEARQGLEPHLAEPSKIALRSMADVTDIIELKHRTQMDLLDTEHIWAPPLIDMRFNYRPENPLYLLIVRAYLLSNPVTIDNTPGYAGCKSWVALEQSVDTTAARPVVDSAEFESRQTKLRGVVQPQ